MLRSASSLAAVCRSSVVNLREAHQAPKELSRRKETMYGSVKSWVTDGSSRAPIFTPEALISSFLNDCQNW